MKHIIYHNKKIFYRAEGQGMPVILIHGFAEDNNVWKHQIKKLKENYKLIIPDLPGSGNSQMLENDITIEDYADVIKAIAGIEINNKDKKTFIIIGHSMGGYVALAFAEKYPELLNGLGLFHSTAYADDEAKKETRRKGIEFIQNKGVELFLKTTIPNLFSEKTKKEKPGRIKILIDTYKNFSGESLIQYYNAMIKRPDRTHVLRSFNKPIFFIAGKNDTAVPIQFTLQQCHLPSISHINVLQNSAHMGMWEETKKANKFLLRFLTYIKLSSER